MDRTRFEWDETKDRLNQHKHGIAFAVAQYAFADPKRVLLKEEAHSNGEERKGKSIYEKENQIHD